MFTVQYNFSLLFLVFFLYSFQQKKIFFFMAKTFHSTFCIYVGTSLSLRTNFNLSAFLLACFPVWLYAFLFLYIQNSTLNHSLPHLTCQKLFDMFQTQLIHIAMYVCLACLPACISRTEKQKKMEKEKEQNLFQQFSCQHLWFKPGLYQIKFNQENCKFLSCIWQI